MLASVPRPDEVASRALGLAALLCRASMEGSADSEEAAAMHALVLRWVHDTGADKGLESHELDILRKPPGTLTRGEVAHAAWRQEELSVLAWALQKAPLPRSHERHKPRWLAKRVGFLADDAAAWVPRATLRPAGQLGQYSVMIEEIRRLVEESWREQPTQELAMAVCVAEVRREAAAWLVGERPLAVATNAPSPVTH
jgi:hypothetical protein